MKNSDYSDLCQSFLLDLATILHSSALWPSSRPRRCLFWASRASISRLELLFRSSHWLTSSSRVTVWSTRRFLHRAAASLFRSRRTKRRFSSSVGSPPRPGGRRLLLQRNNKGHCFKGPFINYVTHLGGGGGGGNCVTKCHGGVRGGWGKRYVTLRCIYYWLYIC